MGLCGVRKEGFGPTSTLSSPLPTSCFIDTIIIPLPVWIALFLLPILLALSHHHRKQNFNPSTAHLRASTRKNWAFSIVSSLYYGLIIANILMEVLEIVRLELIHFGIGLIPFGFVGLILGFALHFTEGFYGRIRGWQAINAVLWLGSLVVNAVKVAGLSQEGINVRKGTKYPNSDQVTDVAVIAGIYAVVAILECILGFWRALRRVRDQRGEESLHSRMSPVVEPVIEIVAKYPSRA
ncbi:hypothetical protein BGZ60DRAFT_466906 [Tricladium varicosporioides]|nr:hypothetical protein BGZ60DRAFT_466906 [Hymenoscyphus varicosporioides]